MGAGLPDGITHPLVRGYTQDPLPALKGEKDAKKMEREKDQTKALVYFYLGFRQLLTPHYALLG